MTTKAKILHSIRQHCLNCVCGSPKEVDLCTSCDCALYPYRFGKDPRPSKARGRDTVQVSNETCCGEGNFHQIERKLDGVYVGMGES